VLRERSPTLRPAAGVIFDEWVRDETKVLTRRFGRAAGLAQTLAPFRVAVTRARSVAAGLNAKELERHLREHGEEICHLRAISRRIGRRSRRRVTRNQFYGFTLLKTQKPLIRVFAFSFGSSVQRRTVKRADEAVAGHYPVRRH
jgi:hypothetical protein